MSAVMHAYVGPITKELTLPKRKSRDGELKARMRSLDPGDSFETNISAQGVRYMAKQLGIKVAVRSTGSGHRRVWRTV